MRVLCAQGPRDAINHSVNDNASFVNVSIDCPGREQLAVRARAICLDFAHHC